MSETISTPMPFEERRTHDQRITQAGYTADTERRTGSERREKIAAALSIATQVGNGEGMLNDEQEIDVDQLIGQVESRMTFAAYEFHDAIQRYPIIEPDKHDRNTTISYSLIDSPVNTSGWAPKATRSYATIDPFHALNGELVASTTHMISTAMEQAEILRPTRNPELTYLSINRGAKGKKSTLLTKKVKDIDPGIEAWVDSLPDAEQLRPVANPWSDVEILVRDEQGVIKGIRQTPALQALVGAAGDGRAVREREAWERSVVSDIVKRTDLTGKPLVITSLGTGTGEPAMDTAISALQESHSEEETAVVVNGFDINRNSLAIAGYIASTKGDNLQFNPGIANILSADGIAKVVGGTKANVYEAIGFAEYVPSDDAPNVLEQKQRETMKRAGCLSAQEFYGAIYENMPQGAVLVTGNMRDDSPQASFVIDGLGWKGIIQRSTPDYLRILEGAGIPGEAVELYVPSSNQSAGVYNLVAITKL